MINTILRMLPALVMAGSLMYGLATSQMAFVFIAAFTVLSDAFVKALKHYAFKPLYARVGKDALPMLGRGTRPDGATNCGFFPNASKPATSFGMPSGHSMDSCIMATFWCLYVAYETDWSHPHKVWACAGFSVMALLVAQSRHRLGCHTVQQIVVGGLIGIVLGSGGFMLWNRIKQQE